MFPMLDLIPPRIDFFEIYSLIQCKLAQRTYGHLNKTSLFLQVWVKPTYFFKARSDVSIATLKLEGYRYSSLYQIISLKNGGNPTF